MWLLPLAALGKLATCKTWSVEHGKALLAELTQEIPKFAPWRGKQAQIFVEAALKGFAALAPLLEAPAEVQEAINLLNETKGLTARIAAWQMGFAMRSRKGRLSYAVGALKNEEEVVRRGAISALEREWPVRADIVPILAGVVRFDRVGRVRQAALSALQRSWRHEPAILDAIAARADEETTYTDVVRLIEYLTKTWRGNLKALEIVLKLACNKPKAGLDYDYFAVGNTVTRALLEGGWPRDPRALAFLKNQSTEGGGEPTAGLVPKNHRGTGGAATQRHWLLFGAGRLTIPTRQPVLLRSKPLPTGGRETRRPWPSFGARSTDDPDTATRAVALRAIAGRWEYDPDAAAFLKDQAMKPPVPATRVAALSAIMNFGPTLPAFDRLYRKMWIYSTPGLVARAVFVRDCGSQDPAVEVRATVVSIFRAALDGHALPIEILMRVFLGSFIK
jgi:hypothetical protein